MWTGLVLAAALAAGPAKIAVIEVEVGAGVPGAQDARVLTEIFASALHDPEAYQLITPGDVGAILKLQHQQQVLGGGTRGDPAQIADGLGADGAVAASIGAVGGGLVVTARLIETKFSSVIARATTPVGEGGLVAAVQKVGDGIRREFRRVRGLPEPTDAPLMVVAAKPAEPQPCATAMECEAACRQGDVGSCTRLARMLLEGPPRDAAHAAPWFQRACEAGATDQCLPGADAWLEAGIAAPGVGLLRTTCVSSQPEAARACARAAEMLFEGKLVPRDPVGAASLAERGCAGGVQAACRVLGLALARGDGRSRDLTRAAEVLGLVCDADDASACAELALVVGAARKGEVSWAQIDRVARRCESGQATACTPAADACSREGDQERSIALRQRACLATPTEVAACELAGQLLVTNGKETAENGTFLWRRACDAGAKALCVRAAVAESFLPGATLSRVTALLAAGCVAEVGPALLEHCFQTGAAIVQGRNQLKDAVAALKIFEATCAAGHGAACNAAATYYRNGNSVARDVEKSLALAEAACTHGFAQACTQLAEGFETGRGGMTRDIVKALKLHELGCTQGGGASCFRLARRYEVGEGVSTDSVRADELRRKACALGLREACE